MIGNNDLRSTSAAPSFGQNSDLWAKIDLQHPDNDLFDGTAKKIADLLKQAGDRNKSSQIRNFYDEVLRYAERHRATGNPNQERELFESDLPLIRMICARAAYSETRKHVDNNFVAFLQTSLRKVETAKDLQNFRSLFEAVIGYSPKS